MNRLFAMRELRMKRLCLLSVSLLFFVNSINAITTLGYFKPMGPGSDFWPFLPDSYPGFGTAEQQNSPQSNPDVFCREQGEGWRLISAGDVNYYGRAYNLGFVMDTRDVITDFGNVLPGHPANYYSQPFIPANRIPVPKPEDRSTLENYQPLLGTLQDDGFYSEPLIFGTTPYYEAFSRYDLSPTLVSKLTSTLQYNSLWLAEVSSPDINNKVQTRTGGNRLSIRVTRSNYTVPFYTTTPNTAATVVCVKDLR